MYCIHNIVDQNIKKLEELFYGMRQRLLTELNSNSTMSAQNLVDSLTMLPVALAEYKEFVQQKLDALEEAKSIRKIFHHISPLLTFIDYHLLKFLIEKFASSELNRDMVAYSREVEVFIDETTVEQLTKVWPGRQKIPPDFVKLTTMIDEDPSRYTLRQLNDLRRKFCCETSLTETVLILIGVGKKNSFLIHWIIPSVYVSKSKSVIGKWKKLTTFYKQEKIASVTLGTHRLYSIAV